MHLVLITCAILTLVWVIIGGFILLFVTTCLLEKLHLNDFVPAPNGEPLADTTYFTVMNDTAKRMGFTAAGVFTQNRKSRLYRAQVALWVSPEQDTLLQIFGGRTARVPLKRAILSSILASNQIVQTQDSATTVDLSGLTDQKLLIHADLHELVSCHRERLDSCGEQKQTVSTETAFAFWQSIGRLKAEEMTRMGFTRFINPEQTIFRYTFKGAWLQYSKGFRGQLAEAMVQADGNPKARPGGSRF